MPLASKPGAKRPENFIGDPRDNGNCHGKVAEPNNPAQTDPFEDVRRPERSLMKKGSKYF